MVQSLESRLASNLLSGCTSERHENIDRRRLIPFAQLKLSGALEVVHRWNGNAQRLIPHSAFCSPLHHPSCVHNFLTEVMRRIALRRRQSKIMGVESLTAFTEEIVYLWIGRL